MSQLSQSQKEAPQTSTNLSDVNSIQELNKKDQITTKFTLQQTLPDQSLELLNGLETLKIDVNEEKPENIVKTTPENDLDQENKLKLANIQCIECHLQAVNTIQEIPYASSSRPVSPPAPSTSYFQTPLSSQPQIQTNTSIKNTTIRPNTAQQRQFVYKSPNKRVTIATKVPRQFIKLQDCTAWLTLHSPNVGPVTRVSHSANLTDNAFNEFHSNNKTTSASSTTSFRYFTSAGGSSNVDANLNKIRILLNKRSTRVNTYE